MSDHHFAILADAANRVIGLELNESKRNLVYVRVLRRLRRLGLTDFDAYCELLSAPDSSESDQFINAITTNVTSFFREPHHFDFVAEELMPTVLSAGAFRLGGARLRIWCAGCSSGQEAYSIAAAVASATPAGRMIDCKILATDIDSGALERARNGVYGATDRDAIATWGDVIRWFDATEDGGVRAGRDIRDMVYVRSLNLIGPWPMTGPIDVIFCRNVAIYFSPESQRRLYERMADLLGPDGVLITGHSESMPRQMDRFRSIGQTIYQIVDRPDGLGSVSRVAGSTEIGGLDKPAEIGHPEEIL